MSGLNSPFLALRVGTGLDILAVVDELPEAGASTAGPAVLALVELQFVVQFHVAGPALRTEANRLPTPGYRWFCLRVNTLLCMSV